MHQQVLENRPQTERRKKGKCANDNDRRHQQSREEAAGHRKGSSDWGTVFFLAEISRDGQHRNDHEESAKQHGRGRSGVVPHGVGVQAGKRRTVIARRRSVGVENLATGHAARDC